MAIRKLIKRQRHATGVACVAPVMVTLNEWPPPAQCCVACETDDRLPRAAPAPEMDRVRARVSGMCGLAGGRWIMQARERGR